MSAAPAAPAAPASRPSILVACLCAQWCGSCREYRPLFDDVAAAFPEMQFLWIDIEDEADLVDPVEVENFPTLLIAAGDNTRFFGPLMPHKETLVRLLRAQADATSGPVQADPEVQALVKRLRG
ncbi:thioredoxin family protein [Sphaerotilaceae bacterium SBD11-9]